jgi:hypothetical protein
VEHRDRIRCFSLEYVVAFLCSRWSVRAELTKLCTLPVCTCIVPVVLCRAVPYRCLVFVSSCCVALLLVAISFVPCV